VAGLGIRLRGRYGNRGGVARARPVCLDFLNKLGSVCRDWDALASPESCARAT
jgi:hypothetical protein